MGITREEWRSFYKGRIYSPSEGVRMACLDCFLVNNGDGVAQGML